MEERWIENLRKRYANKQVPPPGDLWDDIAAAMKEQKGRTSEAKARNRRLLMWWGRAAAVAACVAVVAGIWFFRDEGSVYDVDVPGKLSVVRPSSPAMNNDKGDDEGYVSEKGNETLSGGVIKVKQNVEEDEPEAELLSEEGTADKDVKEDKVPENVISSKAGISHKGNMEGNHGHKHKNNNTDNLLFASGSMKKSGANVSFGLYGAAPSSFGNASGNGISSLRAMYLQSDKTVGAEYLNMPLRSYSALQGIKGSYVIKTKHRQPIRFGASVRFGLTDKLGIETGLSYSYLSSDITLGDEFGKYGIKQRLHYVGVPLNVNYNLWRNSGFIVYASVGGAIDFCVAGQSETETYSAGIVNETSGHLRETRPQLSVNASAGVQYKINDKLGLYAEPGVGYYFDNGSDIVTIYKDKPFNFNLNFGLRISVK